MHPPYPASTVRALDPTATPPREPLHGPVPEKFHVSIAGLMAVNEDAIYAAGPEVFLRELLQNGQDGVSKLHQTRPQYVGEVRIEVTQDAAETTVMIEDNGAGMSFSESRLALSTIAHSTKCGANGAAFVGRFGLGLLSAFLVADEVTIFSCPSDSDEPGVHWVGRIDGTFTARPSTVMQSHGTRVFLRLRADKRERFTPEALLEIARKYGRYLPHRVTFRSGSMNELVTDEAPLWEQPLSQEELLDRGKELFDAAMLSAFHFQSEDAGAQGIAFIQADGCHPSGEASHLVFIKRMMVSENALDLEPAGAPFLRLILNSDRLRPNVGRDAVMTTDSHLPTLRRDVEAALKQHLQMLHKCQPYLCASIVMRQYRCLAQLAVKDQSYLAYLLDYLELETTLGQMPLGDIFRRHGDRVEYVTDTTEFQRVKAKARSEGDCIVLVVTESAHLLMELVDAATKGSKATCITAREYLARFANTKGPPSKREVVVIEAARTEFAKENCVAAFYETDEPDEMARLDIGTDESLLRLLATDDDAAAASKQLLLNRQHQVVSQLIDGAADADQLCVWLRVLYHIALLEAREAPSAAETRRFSRALGNVFTASTFNTL